MFIFDFITNIDSVIIISVEVIPNVNGDPLDHFTIPRIWTFNTWNEWFSTMESFNFFTVVFSPLVFTFDDTVEDFTLVNTTITIFITVFN